MLYLLDTTAVSAIMRENEQVRLRLSGLSVEDRVATCVITEGEIRWGLGRTESDAERIALGTKAEKVFAALRCDVVPTLAARWYARVKLDLRERNVRAQQQGDKFRGLDENDLWIAATCLALDASLVTHDKGFKDVPGLRVDDWMT